MSSDKAELERKEKQRLEKLTSWWEEVKFL